MSINPKMLHGMTEKDLASLQNRQVGNTCTLHAITTALRMLLNFEYDPAELSDEVDRLWRRGRWMRVFPGWAVTPRQQVRILRYLAKQHQLPVDAVFHKGTPEILPGLLLDERVIPIVTLTWLWNQAPPIFYGQEPRNRNASRKVGGHSMIFSAYDPNHLVNQSFTAPWGFINPWKDDATHLYWMRDQDFRKAWGFTVPFNGPRPLVLIHKTSPESQVLK